VESLEEEDIIGQWQQRRINKMSQFMQNLEHQKETLLEEELYNQIDQPQKTITFAKNTKAENTLESLNSELHSENITPQINGFQRKQGFGTCFENFQSKHQEAMLIH